ncbi:hypothetical protein [Streptacidiphilus carbonis]|nr:hypothetical protein [Streptacidiphilus carbonis]
MIKRKMSNWALKRAEHRTPPRPSAPIVNMVEPTKTAYTRRKP